MVLVQPRKTRPFITERLLMGHKESNQTKVFLKEFFENIDFEKNQQTTKEYAKLDTCSDTSRDENTKTQSDQVCYYLLSDSIMQSLSLEQSFHTQNTEVDEGSNQMLDIKPY